MKQLLINTYQLIAYNLRIIFKQKFLYFILSAFAFYILAIVILFLTDSEINEGTGFNILLLPAILIIFYPTCFGIQNDMDNKIIEILFGIPNYRYKVWLTRLFLSYIVCFGVILCLAWLTKIAVIENTPLEITYKLMFPILFLGLLTFMLSAYVRNGNGTAITILIIGFCLFLISKTFEVNKWNVFFNPYNMPNTMNPIIFNNIYLKNKIILSIASIIFLLLGLQGLKKREKFI